MVILVASVLSSWDVVIDYQREQCELRGDNWDSGFGGCGKKSESIEKSYQNPVEVCELIDDEWIIQDDCIIMVEDLKSLN